MPVLLIARARACFKACATPTRYYALPTFVRWVLTLCGRGEAAVAAGLSKQSSVGTGVDALCLWLLVTVIFYTFFGAMFCQLVVPEITTVVSLAQFASFGSH